MMSQDCTLDVAPEPFRERGADRVPCGNVANVNSSLTPAALDATNGKLGVKPRLAQAVNPARVKSLVFLPPEPKSLREAGLSDGEVEALVLKYLMLSGVSTGRDVAEQIKLPFRLVEPILQGLKLQMLIVHRATAPLGDYQYDLTDAGRDRARKLSQRCTYCGAAPVTLEDYIASVQQQSITHVRPRLAHLKQAFRGLLVSDEILSQIGQALHAGKGLFLYGHPGNGKTSIAERITCVFGQHVWIPRTVSVGGDIIRLYDPSTHHAEPLAANGSLVESVPVDRRWVRIRRPTVVAGGELTLDHLELRWNGASGIHEAPLQLKANCGTFVIDDFGRQRVSIEQLLNRWIVPLEKRCDFLTLQNGRQFRIPFDQMLVFSTNLEPKELVDEAFLRRIPYKIEVADPTEPEILALFRFLAPQMGFAYRDEPVRALIAQHFCKAGRAFRFCHVRDLLLQARHFCQFHEQPMELTSTALNMAVKNYFAVV